MRTLQRDGVKLKMKVPANNVPFFINEWEHNGWEAETLTAVERFCAGRTLVDVGAWIGPVTLWALARGATHVYAIEPDPVARSYLEENVAANGWLKRVTIIAGAVADHTGECMIAPHPEQGWASSMTRVAADGLAVSCWTMRDLFAVTRVVDCGLVKIDVEGAEAAFLGHAAPWLAAQRIPVMVAMHEPWWDGGTVDPVWFDGFSSVSGDFHGWAQVLAVP
jgi:FkbM family methyltransferase